MTDALVRTERAGAALLVELGSPPVNALSEPFLADLEAAARAAQDPGVRAVAVTSVVPRIFLAGADLDFVVGAQMTDLVAYVERLQALFTLIERLPVPVVGGIDGACLGGGLELALCFDVRIVGAHATLGLPEARLGILPGAGGTQRLVRTVGQGMARDLLLTGRRLGAEEALDCGLASRAVAAGGAAAAAVAIAAELAVGSPEALAAIKRLALAAPQTGLAEGLASELAEWTTLRATVNAQEGLEAFAERRPPQFR